MNKSDICIPVYISLHILDQLLHLQMSNVI